MTNPNPSPELHEAAYLIRKGGYFYRPNAQGYTASKAEAGRYTLAEAWSHSHPNGPDGPRDGIDHMLDDEPAAPKCAACDGTKVVSQGGHDTGCNACYVSPQTLPAPGEVERLRAALTKAKQAARYVAVGDGYYDPYANHIEAVDAVVDAALSFSVTPEKPLATVAAANAEGVATARMREAIDAGLRAFCSDTSDFTMSSAMRRAAADFIMGQPGMFPLATSCSQHEGAGR
jgi:hypothetical protein